MVFVQKGDFEISSLDTTDRSLIAHLKLDGRASITTLAGALNLSRATVKARLERLVNSGAIRRFTVELDDPSTDDRVHAVMMISVEGVLTRSVTKALKNMANIISLHSTNGAWDLVAHIEASNLAEFDTVLREIREIKGVLNSQTCLLLNRAV